MKALIDNEEVTIDNQFRRLNKEKVPVADHSTALGGQTQYHYSGRENVKLITCGHVYVLNYNPSTYKPKMPLTFDDYLKMKKENPNFKL